MDDQEQRQEGSHVEWEELRVAGGGILGKNKEAKPQGDNPRHVL